MIVDDRISVIGSANINDRSLLGIRDSELNVVLRDTDMTDSSLGGAPWQSGAFASRFREALFAQHVGWSSEEVSGRFADPLSNETRGEIRRIARRNTEIYEELFGALPSDKIRNWAALTQARRNSSAVGSTPTSSPRGPTPVSVRDWTRDPAPSEWQALEGVHGHIVEFPLDFLVEEDLAASTFSVGGLTPECFT